MFSHIRLFVSSLTVSQQDWGFFLGCSLSKSHCWTQHASLCSEACVFNAIGVRCPAQLPGLVCKRLTVFFPGPPPGQGEASSGTHQGLIQCSDRAILAERRSRKKKQMIFSKGLELRSKKCKLCAFAALLESGAPIRSWITLFLFCGSLARVSGLLAGGSLGSVAGLALVFLDLKVLALSHCFTCKTGIAQNSWSRMDHKAALGKKKALLESGAQIIHGVGDIWSFIRGVVSIASWYLTWTEEMSQTYADVSIWLSKVWDVKRRDVRNAQT